MARIITCGRSDEIPMVRDCIQMARVTNGKYQLVMSRVIGKSVEIVHSQEPLDREAGIREAQRLASQYNIDEIYVQDDS